MRFNYTAMSKTGARVTDTIDANDRTGAIRAIESLGHVPISICASTAVRPPVSRKLVIITVVSLVAILLTAATVIGARRIIHSDNIVGVVTITNLEISNATTLPIQSDDGGEGWMFVDFTALAPKVRGECEYKSKSGKNMHFTINKCEVIYEPREAKQCLLLFNSTTGSKHPNVVIQVTNNPNDWDKQGFKWKIISCSEP